MSSFKKDFFEKRDTAIDDLYNPANFANTGIPGSERFNNSMFETLQSQGLATNREIDQQKEMENYNSSLMGRLGNRLGASQHEMQEQAFNLGYGMMYLGTGIGQQITTTQSGNYVTPEQSAQAGNALIPGIAQIAGGIIGGYPGQLAAAGIGSIVQSSLNAGLERQQSVRQTGDLISGVTGETGDALKKFTDALNNAGEAVKSYGQSMQTMLSAGNVTNPMSALAGTVEMTNIMGERQNPTLSGVTNFMSSNAILRTGIEAYSNTGGVGIQSNGETAIVAAASGNVQARNDAVQRMYASAETHQSAVDKEFIANHDPGKFGTDLTKYAKEFWYELVHPTQDVQGIGQAAEDRLKAGGGREVDPVKIAQADAFKKESDMMLNSTFAADSSSQQMQTQLGTAQTNFSIAQLTGASGSTLRSMSGDFATAFNGNVGSMTTQVANLRDAANKATTPQDKMALNDLAGQMQNQINSSQLSVLQAKKAVFDDDFATNNASFSSDIDRDTRRGFSASQMTGRTRTEADYLLNIANDKSSPISDAERIQDRQRASDIVFQNRQQVYGQNLEKLDVTGSQIGVGVATAQTTGSPEQIYQAVGREISNNKNIQAELNNEIAKGSLTYDQILQKKKEINDLTRQNIQLEAQSQQARYQSGMNITQSGISGASAGEDRNVRMYGNSAFSGDVLTGVNSEISQTQAYLNDPKNKINAEQRASLNATVRTLQADASQRQEDVANYRPSAARLDQSSNAQTQYQLSLMAPYQNGNGSPFTRGLAAEADITRSIGELDANRRSQMAKGNWDANNQHQYTLERNQDLLSKAQFEHERIYDEFSALPSAIVGANNLPSGVRAGIMPVAGISAYFQGTPQTGSWGRASTNMTPQNSSQNQFLTQESYEKGIDRIVSALKPISNASKSHGNSVISNQSGVQQTRQNATFDSATRK